jgi:ribosomal protein S18 acetylase RimI-like enzyme
MDNPTFLQEIPLKTAPFHITSAPLDSPDAKVLLEALSETLETITGSSGKASFDPAEMQGERACFVIARNASGAPVGCGAIRPLQEDIAELKRMYAVPGYRGIGSAVLAHLERTAGQLGYRHIWLETRKVNTRAVAFYTRNGYTLIPNYGRYAGRDDAVCFGKLLSHKE